MNPTIVLSTLMLAIIASACGPTQTPAPAASPVGLANPASEFCVASGGTLEIRTGSDGGQAGFCIFADGSECEEWAYFRAECAPSDPAAAAETPVPQPPASAAPIALQVLQPQDGSQIDSQQCEISGITAPGAVVTVNEEIVIAEADGSFHATIALEQGLNLIEVLASDAAGGEAVVYVTVTFGP